MVSCGIATLAFLILMNVASLSWMVVGAMFEGLYYGLFAGVGMTYVQNLSGGKVATGTALYMNSLILGSVVAGPIIGLLGEWANFRTAIKLSLLGVVIALLVLWSIEESTRTATLSDA